MAITIVTHTCTTVISNDVSFRRFCFVFGDTRSNYDFHAFLLV